MDPTNLRIGSSNFQWGTRTYVMGIINLTDDSFSGDGISSDVPTAVELAKEFEACGADIIDIGAQSTRPPGAIYGVGASTVPLEQEIQRTSSVIADLASTLHVPISIDTFRAEVAESAVSAGASLVNDVWSFKGDPAMAPTISNLQIPIILMHNQLGTQYTNFVPDLLTSLEGTLKDAEALGIDINNVIIDPGFGFGKTPAQNLEVIRNIQLVRQRFNRPVLIGTSRKSTIGTVLGGLSTRDRLEGTAATVAISIANGVDIIRVHDVTAMKRVAQMTDALVRGWDGNPT